MAIRGGEISVKGETLVRGDRQDPREVLAATERRRRDIGGALEAFARNTVEHMVEEQDCWPARSSCRASTRTSATGRRSSSCAASTTRPTCRRSALHPRPEPVLVGVDGGANAILEAGLQPDMIVGDMDSASEETLRCGAELVVHAYSDGRAPGREHLKALGLPHKVLPAPGTSQDVAMLIAHEKGASLIVSVGSQFNLVEFLDKNRRGCHRRS